MTSNNDSDLFTSDIQPHPYGVLPSGNVYFGGSSRQYQAPLAEDLFQQVLQYCDGVSLARATAVCRDWYVAGHAPELWRDLVLRENGGHVQSFCNCWKDTFVKMRVGKVVTPHDPISIPNIYSEVYYKTHVCRSFTIPASWMSVHGGNVERITRPLSRQEFLSRYEENNVPVVLSGACKTWKALKKWNTDGYLESVCNETTSFRATSGACPLPAQFTMQAYKQYCACPLLEEAPLYLFDRTALTQTDCSTLSDDYTDDLSRTCPFWYFRKSDLFQYLGASKRPDHTWLICGPQRSGSSFHVDPNATHAWNACIAGRKRWIFYPPSHTPPGVYPSKDGDDVTMPISIGEWLCNFYQQQQHLSQTQALECTVEPGDVVFVPHGWWHAVVNLDDWNVAITHNYVSESNLSNVLRFFSEKQSQISGCRDRTEAIQPEFLRSAFEQALVKNGFETMLNKAKRIAEEGWTCRAWSDNVENDSNGDENKKQMTICARKRKRHDTTSSNSIMAKAKSNNDFSFSFL